MRIRILFWISPSDTRDGSRNMLNTRNIWKNIWMKENGRGWRRIGEGEVTVQMEVKYLTSNLSHLPHSYFPCHTHASHCHILRIPCILPAGLHISASTELLLPWARFLVQGFTEPEIKELICSNSASMLAVSYFEPKKQAPL